MKSFDQLLKEAKRNAQGKRTEEAGASSAKLQASGNLRADAFLKKLGIDRSKYPYTQTKEDVQTFRGKVDELAENTHGILLPSQFRELQSKFPSEYKKLTEEGSDLTSYARSLLNDKQTEMDVFRSNYKLGNIGKQYNTLENRLASFSDDMDYIKATTDGYEDYSKYLHAALGMDDSQLKTDMYTFGKQQNDAGKRTQMTKSELDSEINALVQEITMAKNTQQPAPFDPMGAMGSMGMPAMPTQTTDTSKQEARLAELYGMLERGEYITDEEAKQQKQDYFDRYREDWKAGMDAKDAQIEEAEDILRRGYVSDPNAPLTSEEIDALLDKQEGVQAEMDAEVDPYHAIYGKKDWGAYIGSGVMKGFSDFSNALYQTYDVVLGKPIDYIVNAGKSAIEKVFGVDTGADFRNPLSRWADAYQGVNQQYAQEADRATAAMGESAWWKTGQQVIGGLIQNVPNTVLAFMTGGASAGVTGMQDAAVKAMQTAGSSKLMKTVTNMLSNPQYWSSFAQTLGNDYNDAVQESGDPVKSALYAMASSLINAGIEIGLEGDSGIQGLGRAIEEKDIPGFMRVLKAGGDEYTEEVKQGIVSGIAKKVIYDADKPWISATDNNAVISPELAESATVGGLTGMLMGGGAEVSNAAVGAYNNMQEQRAYEREARRVLFGEQPIDEQQTIKDQETQNAKAAEAYFDRASDLTGEETARQYAMSGRSEEELADTLQTVGIEMTDAVRDAYNTAAVEREENVQQRRAEIEALKRPLAKQQNRDDISAVDADAPVQQSGAETEALKRPLAKQQNRDDVSAVSADAPAQRMEGQPITKAATSKNSAVSAEDAAYQQQVQELNKGGRNGSRKGVLRSISDAEVKKFEKLGLRKFEGTLSQTQRAATDALRKIAETMHINIVHFESPVNTDGQHVGANGFYDKNTNTVYLDLFAGKENEQAVMKAAAHEFTHVIQEWSPEKYTQLQDMLVKYYYSTGNTTLREMVQSQIDKAAAVGNTLDEVQAMDEVTADACEMMFGDIDAMREIYNKDRTLFEKIGEWINKFVDSIKAAMQGLRAGTREADLLMQNAQTWENARKLWYQALEEVGQNNPGSVTETAKTVDQTTEIAENMQISTADQAESESESQEDVNGKNNPETEAGDVQYSLRGEYPVNEEQAEKNKKIVAGMNSVADLRGDEFAVEKGSRNEVRKYYESLGGEVQNAEIGDVAITWRSIRDALGHGVSKEKMAAFHAVPAVIENGHVINVQKKWKGRELDTAVIAAPITIAGEKYYAGVVVSRPYFSKVQRYYTHEVLIQKERDSAVQNRGPENGALPVGESLTIKSLLDQLRNVKSEDVETNIRYSLRDTEYKTDRELLATALESAAVTEEEQKMLKEYQQIAADIDNYDERVRTINQKIREIRKNGGKWFSEEEVELVKEREGLEKKIEKADKRLMYMNEMRPIRQLANRQRKEFARNRLDKYKAGVVRRETIVSIERTAKRLARKITDPNKQHYVPDEMRKPLAQFLTMIDRSSERKLKHGVETGEDMKFDEIIEDLKEVIESIDTYQEKAQKDYVDYAGMYDLSDGFIDRMAKNAKDIKRHVDKGGTMTLQRMEQEELDDLYKTLAEISANITNTNAFLSSENAKTAKETAESSIKYMDAQAPAKTESKIAEFLNWDNLQPAEAFARFGEGGNQIFRFLQKGQSKLAFNTKRLLQETKEMYNGKEVKEWSEETKTFEINGEKIEMPVAHIMSLYCMTKREQAIGHLYGEGIRVGNYKKKGKTIIGTAHNITREDIAQIVSTLTERQIKVADAMQELMSTLGSEWGNEVSMKRFGWRLFTEQFYFPIQSDKEHFDTNTEKQGTNLYRLLNISSSKPLTRGANNRVMVNNIFDVFAGHMSDMAQYNAMALPVLDALKWLNYRESTTGEKVAVVKRRDIYEKITKSVKDSAREAYGSAAVKYITGVLRDINGAQMTGGMGEGFSKQMLGRANRASVAMNMRVAFLQPLSLVRAAMVMNTPDILKGAGMGIAHIRKNIAEMMEYSGIAVWKDLGFYDVNIGRSVTQLIKNDKTAMDKLIDGSMKGAELADKLTWALIWESAKKDVAHTTAPSSSDYMKKVAERFEEVIYQTQVVDSVLTKSQYMRGTSFTAKWLSSFMSEPTVSYNMLLKAYNAFAKDAKSTNFQQAWKKNGKLVLRTMSVYTIASAVSAIVESLMSAWRDDDDYETFMEKFQEGFYDSFVNNIMPFNKLPIVKDLYEYAKKGAALLGADTYGYDSTNPLMKWADQLIDGFTVIQELTSGKPTNYTYYGGIYKVMQAVSSGTGIPISNAMREAAAIWNNTIGYMTGHKIVTYKTSKSAGYERMYEAILSDNAERVTQIQTELKENGAEDKQIISGLRSLAKQDYIAGNLTAEEVSAFLMKHCDMDEDEAYWKLEEWAWEAQEEAENFSVYGALEEALLTGVGIGEAVKRLTDHGYEKSKVQSKVRELVKDGYLAGDLTQTKVTSLLKAHGGLTDNEAYFKQQQYEYERLTGDSTSSDACMIFYEIDNKRSPAKAIDAALKHGKTKSGLASSLTSRYKEQYLELLKTNKSAAYQLATRLAGVFDYLGYKGTQKVQEWK